MNGNYQKCPRIAKLTPLASKEPGIGPKVLINRFINLYKPYWGGTL